jgi:hypothetical protein
MADDREQDASAAQRAYARGDFARVRELLAAPGGHDDGALRRVTSVDPVHAAILAICALGLLVIAVQYGA